MSYCRTSTVFWSGGKRKVSDVYVFGSSESLECCGCEIVPVIWHHAWIINKQKKLQQTQQIVWSWGSFSTTSRGEMILHLLTHRQMGQSVPYWAIRRLLEELDHVGDNYAGRQSV